MTFAIGKHLTLTGTLTTLVACGAVLAAEPDTASSAESQVITEQTADQVLASELLETVVVGADGIEIGLVENLLVDGNGRLVGVLVEIGGFLGVGEKLIAVKPESLDVATKEEPEIVGEATGATEPHEVPARARWVWWDSGRVERIVLDLTRAELEAVPAFQLYQQDS